MRPIFRLAMLMAACAVAPAVATGQGACPEGRTATGECVNPLLADSMRQIGIIFSQPKLSYTHYPVLPSVDWNFRYPHELNPDPLKPSPTGTPIPPPPIP